MSWRHTSEGRLPDGEPRRTRPGGKAKGGTSARADKIHKGLDALIDGIDEALEEKAEEFVTNYLQRGGQ